MFKTDKLHRQLLAAGASLVAFSANAATDVTAITAAVTDVGVVATAVFGVYVAIKAAKFIRRAL